MTVKEYLQQVYHMDQEVRRMKLRIAELQSDLYGIRSPVGTMEQDKVRSSFPSDKLADTIAKLDEKERDYLYAVDVLEQEKDIITKQIRGIENEQYKNVLYDRYVLLWKWEKIAVEMNYNMRYVQKLHGKALKEFEKIVRGH